MSPEIRALLQSEELHAPLDRQSPLDVSGLTVAYGSAPAVWNVDFKALPGTLVAIVVPNGAGKSTFLKVTL